MYTTLGIHLVEVIREISKSRTCAKFGVYEYIHSWTVKNHRQDCSLGTGLEP